MNAASRDPSKASIRLTRNNYHGPRLLRCIGGKSAEHIESQTSPYPRPFRLRSMDDSDIYAEPQSGSDNDETSDLLDTTVAPIPEVGTKSSSVQPRRSKRGATSWDQQQSLEKIAEADQTNNEPASSMGSLFDGVSQSSQNKRRKVGYGNKYKKPPSADCEFNVPAKLDTSQRPARAIFNPVSQLPTKHERLEPSATGMNAIPELPPKPQISTRSAAVFFAPSIVPGSSSASTITSEVSQPFDLPQFTCDDPSDPRARRDSSVSSLSSADSIELEYTAQIDRPSTGTDRSRNTGPCCPLCSASVSHTFLEEFNPHRRMNLRAQQKFCQEHKKRDAQASLQRSGYPDIDWEELGEVRIPQHIKHLNKVLSKKAPSYYRTKLEAAATTDNARKGLQKYLKQDFADVVKTGYYGLRGTRVFTHAITTAMTDRLKQALRKDKLIQAVEVGGFVNVVLVPELTLRLVMEDMGWLDDETKINAGLQVLEESESIGRDLWGDDDEKVLLPD